MHGSRSCLSVNFVASQSASRDIPAEWFSDTVRVDPLIQRSRTWARAPVPAWARRAVGERSAGNSVTFEPGARTAWHTYPVAKF